METFAFDWAVELNWLVPPVHVIEKTVKHFRSSATGRKEILVCLYWTSATFCPLTATKVN